MFGVCLCLGCVWGVFEKCSGSVWEVFGKCLGSVRECFGVFGSVWEHFISAAQQWSVLLRSSGGGLPIVGHRSERAADF